MADFFQSLDVESALEAGMNVQRNTYSVALECSSTLSVESSNTKLYLMALESTTEASVDNIILGRRVYEAEDGFQFDIFADFTTAIVGEKRTASRANGLDARFFLQGDLPDPLAPQGVIVRQVSPIRVEVSWSPQEDANLFRVELMEEDGVTEIRDDNGKPIYADVEGTFVRLFVPIPASASNQLTQDPNATIKRTVRAKVSAMHPNYREDGLGPAGGGRIYDATLSDPIAINTQMDGAYVTSLAANKIDAGVVNAEITLAGTIIAGDDSITTVTSAVRFNSIDNTVSFDEDILIAPGLAVTFTSIAGTTDVSENTTYYATSVTRRSIQLLVDRNDAIVVEITNNGTGTISYQTQSGFVQIQGGSNAGIKWVAQGSNIDNPSISIPSRGNASFADVSVSASKGLDAVGVSIREKLDLTDNTVMTVSEGGVTDPTTTPVVTAVWPTQLTLPANNTWTGVAYDPANGATGFWFSRSNGVLYYTPTGTAPDKTFNFGSGGWQTVAATGLSGTTLNKVRYADGLYMIVGRSNGLSRIFSSSNGINWSNNYATTFYSSLYDIAYSKSRDEWLAVGWAYGREYGQILRSTDNGITWNEALNLTTANSYIYGVARSDAEDMWVAVGRNNRILVSENGTQWTEQMPSTGIGVGKDLYAVARSDKQALWVAVGEGGVVATSRDGVNWTRQVITSLALRSVAYSSALNQWIAVGGSNTILTSTDAVTWSSRTNSGGGTTTTYYDVTYSDFWVIVGKTGSNLPFVATSNDGINWASQQLGTTSNVLQSVARSAGNWLVAGTNSLLTSSDAGVAINNSINGVAVSDSDAFLIAGSPSSSNLVKFNKTDGAQTQRLSIQEITALTNKPTVFYDDSKVKVVTQNALGQIRLTSYDPNNLANGLTSDSWTTTSRVGKTNLTDMTYADGKWVLVGNSGVADPTTAPTLSAGPIVHRDSASIGWSSSARSYRSGLTFDSNRDAFVINSNTSMRHRSVDDSTSFDVGEDLGYNIADAPWQTYTFSQETSANGASTTLKNPIWRFNSRAGYYVAARNANDTTGQIYSIFGCFNGSDPQAQLLNTAQPLYDITIDSDSGSGARMMAVGKNEVWVYSWNPNDAGYAVWTRKTNGNRIFKAVAVAPASTDPVLGRGVPRWVAITSSSAFMSLDDGTSWTEFGSGLSGTLNSIAHGKLWNDTTFAYDRSVWVIVGNSGKIFFSEIEGNSLTWKSFTLENPNIVGSTTLNHVTSEDYSSYFTVAGNNGLILGLNAELSPSDPLRNTRRLTGGVYRIYNNALPVTTNFTFAGSTRPFVVGNNGIVVNNGQVVNSTISGAGTNNIVSGFQSTSRETAGITYYNGSTTTLAFYDAFARDSEGYGGGFLPQMKTVSADNRAIANWTVVDRGSQTFNAVAHSSTLNQWVKVGLESAQAGIWTSTDTVTWTKQTVPVAAQAYELNNIAFGNGLWVAVGNNGTILTSSNGTSWSTATSSTTAALRAVTFDNNLWVAVGDGGVIRTSSSGTGSWTSRTSGTTNNLNDIAYGRVDATSNGWVTVGNNSTILFSTNGTSWSSNVYLDQTGNFKSIVFANRENTWYVALANRMLYGQFRYWYTSGGTGTVDADTAQLGFGYYSGQITGTGNYLSLAYSEDQDVLLVGSDDKVQRRLVSNTFSTTTLLANANVRSVAYANKTWVAVGESGLLATSSDAGARETYFAFSPPSLSLTTKAFLSQFSLTGRSVGFKNSVIQSADITSAATISWDTASMFFDQNKVKVVGRNLSNSISIASFDPDNLASTPTIQTLDATFTNSDMSIRGAARFTSSGVDYYALMIVSSSTQGVYCFNATTGVRAPSLDFDIQTPSLVNQRVGLMYRSTQTPALFYTGSSPSATSILKYSSRHPGSASEKVYVRYAYQDDVNNTTRISSSASIDQPARTYLSVTTPSLPAGATKATVYVRGNASDDTAAYKAITSTPYDEDPTTNLTVDVGALGPWSGIFTSSNGTSWTAQSPAVGTASNSGWTVTDYGNHIYYDVAHSVSQNRWVKVGIQSPSSASFLSIWRSDDGGVTWTQSSVTGGNVYTDTLFSVARSENDNLWVTVGQSGVIYRSTDGITWTRQQVSTQTALNDVANNNTGNWVAVGNRYMYRNTANGISADSAWTSTDLTSSVTLNAVTYSAAQNAWVAVGNNGLIYRSTNAGETWTKMTSPTSASLYDVGRSEADNLWVAVGIQTYLLSNDGINWTAYSSPHTFSGVWYSRDENLWTAVGNAGKILTSFDGIVWIEQTSGTTSNLTSVANILPPPLTIADPTTAATVTNVWPTQFSVTQNTWTGATYDSADSSFWFGTSNGVKSYASNGVGDKTFTLSAQGWTTVATSTTRVAQAAAYSPTLNQWVKVGFDLSNPTNGTTSNIWTSTDTVTWTPRTSTSPLYFYDIAWSNTENGTGLWVVVGDNGVINTSANGASWTAAASGTANSLYAVARSEAQDLWVAVGANGTIRTSNTGTGTWTAATSNTSSTLYGVAYSAAQNLWVAVGQGGRIVFSTTGATWSLGASGTTASLNSVATNGSLWVAVGSSGTIRTSTNPVNNTTTGTPWTTVSSGTTANLRSVAYLSSQNLWVIVGENGLILTSQDGSTWTSVVSGTTATLYDVATGNNTWLTLSITIGAAAVLTSPDAGGGGSLPGNVLGVATGTGDAGTSRGFALGGSTLARFNKTDGTVLQSVSASTYTSRAARASIFYDDNTIKVVTQDAPGTGGKVQLVAYDPANLSTTPTTQTLDSGFTGSFSFYGAARFTVSGTNYYAIALSDSTRSGVYCFNASTGVRASQFDFADSEGNVPVGLAYDATRFYTLPTATATALQKHSTYHPGSNINAYVRYSYTSTDGVYSTRTAPVASVALSPRAFLDISVPNIPRGATKAKIFLRGAASDSTGANTYKLLSSDASTSISQYGSDITTGFDSDTTTLGPWTGPTEWANATWLVTGESGVVVRASDGAGTSFAGSANAVTYSDSLSLFVVVGARGSIKTSPDGVSWTNRSFNTPRTLWAVNSRTASTGIRLVAVGALGTILTSEDGISWTNRSDANIVSSRLQDVKFADGRWVAVGYNGNIVTSTNGTTWVTTPSNTTSALSSVGYSASDDLWVVVGFDSTILTSPDGLTWSPRNSAIAGDLTDVTYSTSEDLWVIVGKNGAVQTSKDGFLWTARASGVSSTLNSVARADSPDIWMAVGNNGRVMTSNDAGVGADAATQILDPAFTTVETISFYGAARFTVGGTAYYAISMNRGSAESNRVYCFEAVSGDRAPQYDFTDSQGDAPSGGLAYDGTRFYTLATPASQYLERHSTFHPGVNSSSVFVRFAYALYNSTAVPAISESTRLSPAASLLVPARGFISIVTPKIPNGAERVDLYIRGSNFDDFSYRRITDNPDALTSYTLGDIDFTTGLTTNISAVGPWGGTQNSKLVGRLAEDLSQTDPILTVSVDSKVFEPLTYLLIDDEIIRIVSSITGSTYNILRGQLNTTAAAHSQFSSGTTQREIRSVNNVPAKIASEGAGWELWGNGLFILNEFDSDPANPSSNQAVLFVRDNGSGKTQLCVRFSSGAIQVIATQP